MAHWILYCYTDIISFSLMCSWPLNKKQITGMESNKKFANNFDSPHMHTHHLQKFLSFCHWMHFRISSAISLGTTKLSHDPADQCSQQAPRASHFVDYPSVLFLELSTTCILCLYMAQFYSSSQFSVISTYKSPFKSDPYCPLKITCLKM
jgi:hypothetical protein